MNDQNNTGVLEPPTKPVQAKATLPAPALVHEPVHRESYLAWAIRSAPTLLVICLLGGLAYWGHHTGWSIPKFNELLGSHESAKDDWCQEHSVPESICIECNESLMPRIKSTWCRVHGVHNCPFERPDVVESKTSPAISQEDLDRAQRALDLKERKENSSKCKQHHRRIQFASEDIVNKMGIDIAPVWQGPIVETVAASGEIAFEQPRVAPVSVPVAGRVWYLTDKGTIGTHVKRGDVLALVDATEVGKAKTELLQAYAQTELRKKSVDMLKPLIPQGVLPESKLMEADLALREARIRLMGAQQALTNMGLPIQIDESKVVPTDELGKQIHFFGIPAEIVSRLDPKTTTANLMPVMASRDGIVTAAKVTVGEMVEPGKPLFVVSDTSRMWLILNVRLEDVDYLRVRDPKTNAPGQTVKFRADGKKKDVVGELVWKSTEVDEKTRTVRYRAELPNTDGSLLANTFGTGQIVLRAEKDAIVVPNEAVHWEGDCHIVFVRDRNYLDPNGKKVFHVRTVRPGVMNGPSTEIIAGVLPGEVVATRNSANLRSELLKNNLGAG
jgi:cobalt-zinc-cadmium efflux system membrane fusion protein